MKPEIWPKEVNSKTRRHKESPPLPPEETQTKTIRLVPGWVLPCSPRPSAPATSLLPVRPPGHPRPSAPAPATLPIPLSTQVQNTSQSRPGRSLSLGRRASSPRRRFPTLARPRFQDRDGARAPVTSKARGPPARLTRQGLRPALYAALRSSAAATTSSQRRPASPPLSGKLAARHFRPRKTRFRFCFCSCSAATRPTSWL